MQRAAADVGLMFVAYNLRRIINIIGQTDLKKYLQVLVFYFYQICMFVKCIRAKMSPPNFYSMIGPFILATVYWPLKWPIFSYSCTFKIGF